MDEQSQDLKDQLAADGRRISQPQRQASRTRRSPARTHRQALPLRTRTSRRSHPQETQAPAQRPDGRHPAPASAGPRARVVHLRASRARAPACARLSRVADADAPRSRRPAVHRRRAAAGADRRARRSAGRWRSRSSFSAGFFAFFFRDPRPRARRPIRHVVLSPADGRVLVAGPALPTPRRRRRARGSRSASSCRRWTCTSTASRRRAASRGQLSRPAGSSPPTGTTPASANERSEIWIDHGGQTVVARQIVGMLARRVVCRVAASATRCAPATGSAS